ncbi:Squalene epoxidase 2 [Hibiscus syriacus]|uniref:Squalene monooxygenase n=1 Tax=Hibiscus syriacus TaxID=106335 RepID=A0A6A2WTM6_HIBSY|nr:squalene monooxygenase SE2-like isoform X2 [Hibiscus syriacus]KAE8664653.1 Squalene epoxidase 2 [Hibiscus syriacus]
MEVPNGNCGNKNGNFEALGTTDIIIVGAGVAGASLAYSLGKDGRRVRVIERDLNEPNRVMGEVLMPGGYLKLIELGLQDCVDEIDAQRILGYVLYKDRKEVPINFPLQNYQSHVAGRLFHNGRFVQRLRNKAASLHNVSLEQGTVTSLIEENGTVRGVHYKDKSGDRLLSAYAPLTVVCNGYLSNLRRSLCNPKVDVPSYFVGLVLTGCKLPNENYGGVIIADPSPIVFYPISSTEIRCMVDVPSQNLPSLSNGEMSHYLKNLVAAKVIPELRTAFVTAIEEKDNIRVMANKIMAARPRPTPGALLIGDALNMRHALTGGGMTVALSDVVLLRDLLRPLHDLSDASSTYEYLESFYVLRKPMSSTINTLANVMQKMFSASSDPAIEHIQQSCLGYLRLGVFAHGLSAVHSGLSPRPLSLAFHLLAMAIYGVCRLLLPFPSPKRLWNAAKLLWVGSSIVLPFIQSEGVRQMFFPLTVPSYYRTPPETRTEKYEKKLHGLI